MAWLIGICSALIAVYLIAGALMALYVMGQTGDAYSLKFVFLWLPMALGWL